MTRKTQPVNAGRGSRKGLKASVVVSFVINVNYLV